MLVVGVVVELLGAGQLGRRMGMLDCRIWNAVPRSRDTPAIAEGELDRARRCRHRAVLSTGEGSLFPPLS